MCVAGELHVVGPVVGLIKHSVALGELSSAALVWPCAVLPFERPTANEPGIYHLFFLVICIQTMKGLIQAILCGIWLAQS